MKITLKSVRIAFANGLFEARSVGDSAKATFNASFLFAPGSDQHKEISTAIKQVAAEKWKAKADDIVKTLAATDKLCCHDGDLKPNYAGHPGNKYVSANNAVRPEVRDRDGRTPLAAADGRPYSGCYVNAILDIWAQDNKYGKRVNATLLGVQFLRDGEAFSGGASAADDDFEDVSGDGSSSPATADDLV